MEIWKCKFCDKELELKNKYTKSGHLANCFKFKIWKEKTLTKKFLIEEYINKEKSAIEIANELGFNSSSIINNYLLKHNIQIRNISESKKLKRCKEKYKNTYLKICGAPHMFCKNSSIKKEITNKLLKEEGIINVFQRESVKKKIKNTFMKKYGVEFPMHVEEIKQKVFYTTYKNHGVKYGILKSHNPFFISTPHKKIIEILKNNNIKFEIEKQTNINNYRVDIFIKPNFIIEINGDFWHANPKIYKENDILNFPRNKKPKVKEIWKKDKKRIALLEKNNYIVNVFWEYDINNNINEIEDKILCKLKELKILQK
jgi:very-short-patch-repair endonuclease